MVVVDNPVQTKLRADAKAKEEEIRADTTTPAASLAKLTEAVMAQGKKDEDLSRAVRDSMASRGGGMWLVRPTPGLPSMRSSWRAKWNGDQSLTILSKIFLMTRTQWRRERGKHKPKKKKKQTGAFEPHKKRGGFLRLPSSFLSTLTTLLNTCPIQRGGGAGIRGVQAIALKLAAGNRSRWKWDCAPELP